MKNYFMALFLTACAAHLSEHVAQAVQVYGLGMPLHESRGLLGRFYPWLVHSEWLHYGYALFMLVGLWLLRDYFTGKARWGARWWWMLAFWVQFWHHFEHALLLGQAVAGTNFFGAPQPISVIQFAGFLNGPAETGFGGLLKMSHFGICTCQGAKPGTVHTFTPLMLLVRRVEVHLLYNIAVTVPMIVAMVKAQRSRA